MLSTSDVEVVRQIVPEAITVDLSITPVQLPRHIRKCRITEGRHFPQISRCPSLYELFKSNQAVEALSSLYRYRITDCVASIYRQRKHTVLLAIVLALQEKNISHLLPVSVAQQQHRSEAGQQKIYEADISSLA